MSRTKLSKKSTGLALAVRQMREALEETQEGMARRLGCTLSGYIQWEKGRRTPGGAWLLKLIALAPDSQTQQLFQEQVLAAPAPLEAASARPRPAVRTGSTTPDQRRQAKDLAHEAIAILLELGEAGYRPADQKLKRVADELNRVAGDFSRAFGHKG